MVNWHCTECGERRRGHIGKMKEKWGKPENKRKKEKTKNKNINCGRELSTKIKCIIYYCYYYLRMRRKRTTFEISDVINWSLVLLRPASLSPSIVLWRSIASARALTVTTHWTYRTIIPSKAKKSLTMTSEMRVNKLIFALNNATRAQLKREKEDNNNNSRRVCARRKREWHNKKWIVCPAE